MTDRLHIKVDRLEKTTWESEARAVLQGIAEMDPWIEGNCVFPHPSNPRDDEEHPPDCLWLRAGKLVE